MSAQRVQVLLLGILLLGAYALSIAPLYGVVLDDSYITYRYAENLADGLGAVFNAGERVEGYSNPSWMALLALGHRLGVSVPGLAKVAGVLSALGCLFLIWRMARDLFGMSVGMTWLACLFVATNIGFTYYSISGMETTFFVFTILGFFYAGMRDRFMLAACLGGLMVLTRPEGPMYLVAIGFWLLVRRGGRAWPALVLPLLVLVSVALVKHGYYGAWLPNTHAAKLGYMTAEESTVMSRLWALGRYTFSEDAIPIYLWVLMLLGASAMPGWATLMALSVIGGSLFFVWYSGGDWMSFQRFYAPALPLLAVLAFAAADRMRAQSERAWQKWAILLVGLIWLLPSVQASRIATKRLLAGEYYNPAMNAAPHEKVGAYLRDHTQAGDAVVVNEIGAIGYVSKRTVIDMMGLTDQVIPSFFAHREYDKLARYILARHPKYVLLNDRQAEDSTAMHPIHQSLHDAMMDSGRYRVETTLPLNRYKHLIAYVRVDQPRQ
jgi:hypothetical protein